MSLFCFAVLYTYISFRFNRHFMYCFYFILTLNSLMPKFIRLHSRKCIWKCRQRNRGHFVSALMWIKWGVGPTRPEIHHTVIGTHTILKHSSDLLFLKRMPLPSPWFVISVELIIAVIICRTTGSVTQNSPCPILHGELQKRLDISSVQTATTKLRWLQ